MVYKNKHLNENKLMQTRILSKEIPFWVSLITSIGISEEEKLCGGSTYLRPLIRDIKAGKVSLENFTICNAVTLGELLNSPHLDQKLLAELSHLLYGADERARYFSTK
jgi:hypothetical protein